MNNGIKIYLNRLISLPLPITFINRQNICAAYSYTITINNTVNNYFTIDIFVYINIIGYMNVNEIIDAIGGTMRASRLLQVDATAIARWKRSRTKGGYEYIPPSYWNKIIELAPAVTMENLHNLQTAAQRKRRYGA
jgi:hypothetical protein